MSSWRFIIFIKIDLEPIKVYTGTCVLLNTGTGENSLPFFGILYSIQ
jgi:hypothetical protein